VGVEWLWGRLSKKAGGEAPSAGQMIKDDTIRKIAIFARLIKADDGDLSRELARYILTLGFDEPDCNASLLLHRLSCSAKVDEVMVPIARLSRRRPKR
jgi:hypothetical protein